MNESNQMQTLNTESAPSTPVTMEDYERTLRAELDELEAKEKVVKEKLHRIWDGKAEVVKSRLKQAKQGKGDFQLDELIFSAGARCEGCKGGLAYPKDIGMHGSWYCSEVLLGRAPTLEAGKYHDELPFMFYEVKSEQQPSANGYTTRPAS